MLVGIVPLPSLPDDCNENLEQVTSQMKRCVEECTAFEQSGVDSVLLVNERSFPFSANLTVRDIAAATRMVLELRHSVGHIQIGVDLVDDAESTFAVASAVGCDFVRVRVAGPYVGLTNGQRVDTKTLRQLSLRSRGNIQTWVSLLPWGEHLADSWTITDFAAALVDSVKPDKICVPLVSANEITSVVDEHQVVFDGGVRPEHIDLDIGTFVLGSSLRDGSIENPLNVDSMALLTKRLAGGVKSL